ncbi:sensor histidine kinase [Pseudonocardia spinosispora]|uniref:sensor histidine kinase n=1 Tax=Pseudonocardia spinosispora TaxID=103441 RepID=UPI00040079BC|nr:sensor histidine kinase [Pseudonocardia spinosispora]
MFLADLTLTRRASLLVGAGAVGVLAALLALFPVTGSNAAAVDELLDHASPARRTAAEILTTLVEEQNAVRGFALTGSPAQRSAYEQARARQDVDVAALREVLVEDDTTATDQMRRLLGDIQTWRAHGADPLLNASATQGPRPAGDPIYLIEEQSFSVALESAKQLVNTLDAHREDVVARLRRSRDVEFLVLIGGGLFAATAGTLTILLLRRWVIRPIVRLAADSRMVADGDHSHEVSVPAGPPELADVAADVERMRSRIVSELSSLAASQAQLRATQEELQSQAVDLMRSNRDLEQFAYVASHDLQEPLRKVAGFVQLLQRRYAGQLDDRADQYIEFAVDGAQRMQQLISELLAFSRVGRSDRALTDVSLQEVAEAAVGELELAREEAGARIVIGTLPTVHGDPVLLRPLLMNLIGNAVKFRRPDVPAEVVVDAVPDRFGWQISVRDNGIGIKPEFQDKVFVLFQRLHGKGDYPGTGIGLALAKRIVEFHGGRIWLDTERTDGTTIRFTLPSIEPSIEPHTERSIDEPSSDQERTP